MRVAGQDRCFFLLPAGQLAACPAGRAHVASTPSGPSPRHGSAGPACLLAAGGDVPGGGRADLVQVPQARERVPRRVHRVVDVSVQVVLVDWLGHIHGCSTGEGARRQGGAAGVASEQRLERWEEALVSCMHSLASRGTGRPWAGLQQASSWVQEAPALCPAGPHAAGSTRGCHQALPGFSRSSSILSATLVPSVMRYSRMASAGKAAPAPPPGALAALAASGLVLLGEEMVTEGCRSTVWYSPTWGAGGAGR